jgi:hypothetical protein
MATALSWSFTLLKIDDYSLEKSKGQSAIYRACIHDRIPRVAVKAGRKFGKTYVSVRIARDWAAAAPGEIILIAAPEYPYLRDQTVPELMTAIPAEMLKGGDWGAAYHKTEHALTLANDAKILLRSMDNADAVRPLSVAGLIAEEFSLWSRYAWEECVRMTLAAKNALALFIFTPKGMNQAHELWQRAIESENGRYRAFTFTSYDGILPKEAIDAEAESMPEGVRRQEIYAEFLDDLGGVFSGVRDCVAGDLEEAKPGVAYVIGADVGATNDFNVADVIRRDTRAVVWQERYTGVEPESVAVIWIDDTGIGWGVAGSLRKLGAPVKPYRFTGESKRKLITNLVMAISARNIRYPDIPELVNELNIYESKQTSLGNIQYSAPEGYHDDCVIALALACWGLGRGGAMPLIVGGTTDGIERPSYKPAL